MSCIGTVVDFQPALFRFDWCGTPTYPCTIPAIFPGSDDAFVFPPVYAIRGFCKPDIITANVHTARAVQGIKFPIDLFFKNGAILIVRRNDHPFGFKMFPVFRSAQPYTYPLFRYRSISQVVSTIQQAYPAIFYSKSFLHIFSLQEGVVLRLIKTDSIFTAQ
ncbi:hypothetical protein D3C85_1179550 [compost metagenome]